MAVGEVITERIQLRGAALKVMKTKAPEVLLVGAAGTGKSFAALYKIHLMAMMNPGARFLMLRKTHRSLAATGLVTFREQVAKTAIAAGICRWYGGSGEKPAQYIYTNGASIVVGGLDNADKIMSAEYDVVFIQEATDCTKDDIEKVSTRLRNGVVSFQQLIMDCNPQQPSHHLKKRCDDGITQMLTSVHEDNPRLFDDAGQITEYGAAYMARLDALQGVRYLRLRLGKWAAAEGIIYTGWRPDVHLTDRKRLPREWRRIWSVDFGFRHPFVWQMWAIDPDGALWLEKEIYRSERLVEDHAKDILEVVTYTSNGDMSRRGEWIYPRPEAIICDHDAEDRATLEKHLGMGTIAAHKSVSDGIQAVQQRLKIQGNGRPGLYVCRDSLVYRDQALKEAGRPTCFAEEIEGYVWKTPTVAAQARGELPPDEPNKDMDDSMDATRYAVAFQDLASRPRVRWL